MLARLLTIVNFMLRPFPVELSSIYRNKVRGLSIIRDLEVILRTEKNPLIFDVGANVGEATDGFLKSFTEAKVIMFEPAPECCSILKERFRGFSNVDLESVAIGDKQGFLELNLISGSNMNSLLQLSKDKENLLNRQFKEVGKVVVEVETLDSYCSAKGIRNIALLKLDTQGYDLKALKGADELFRTRSIKALLIEVNFIPIYEQQGAFEEIHRFLDRHGYRLVDFYNKRREGSYLGWCDACYVPKEA